MRPFGKSFVFEAGRKYPRRFGRTSMNCRLSSTPTRNEVLPYLGVRHITGNKKWDSYAKARYIAAMLEEGHSIDDIVREVGDRSQGVLRNAVSYKVLQQAR